MRLGILASILGIFASPWTLGAPSPDLAEEARTILGAGQGVFIEDSLGTVLLDQAGSVPVHPASVSKVPTTLALLRKFGPDYRFVTTFATSGRIVDGTLYGDLLVKSEGDPSLVDENALLVTEHLRELGIQRVVGNLHLVGPLMFDWQSDDGGDRLRQALSGRISAQALAAVRDLQPVDSKGLAATAIAPQAIVFVPAANWSATDIARSKISESAQERPLLVHRSQPLLPLAKSLNDYSNNIFKPLADEAGGAEAVTTVARSVLPETMRGEITLGDGAGTDPRNRLSPRAAVKLLRALEHELAASGHKLYDILPVSGIDEGTLRKRLNGPEEAGRVVGKTGTYGDYGASALVGAIPTTDRGTVYFAILNHGIAVPEARRRQDRFVAVLLAHLHSEAWDYRPDVRSAIARAEVLASPP